MTGSGKDCCGRVAVEMSGPHLTEHFGGRLLGILGDLVRARLDQGFVMVHGSQQSPSRRDVAAGQVRLGIPIRSGARGVARRPPTGGPRPTTTSIRSLRYTCNRRALTLRRSEWPRLVPDGVGHTELAEVVQQGGPPQERGADGVQPVGGASQGHEVGYGAGVADGEGGLHVAEVGHRLECCVEVPTGQPVPRRLFCAQHRLPGFDRFELGEEQASAEAANRLTRSGSNWVPARSPRQRLPAFLRRPGGRLRRRRPDSRVVPPRGCHRP